MEENQTNMYSSFPNAIDKQMEIVTPTYDQHIIKPPDRNKTHRQRSKRLIVDSRERNMELYPDPSRYILDIEHEYRDVISVELSQAQIPNSFYNIYHNIGPNGTLHANNILHLNLTTTEGILSKNFELPTGKYKTTEKLNEKLKDLIKNTINPHVKEYLHFHVDIDEFKGKLNITMTPKEKFGHIISFYFEFEDPNICPTLNPNVKDKKQYPSFSIGPILGFNIKNVGQYAGTVTGHKHDKNIYGKLTNFVTDFNNCDSKYPQLIFQDDPSTIYTIEKIISKKHLILTEPLQDNLNTSLYFPKVIIAPNVIELECDKYIILDIRELHRLKSNTDTIDDRFAVIPIDYSKCSTIINFAHIPTQREIKYFNPPYARFAKLRIAFYRYNGDPLFFNGVNHLLDFNITALNQAGKYNNINSGTINN